MNPSTEPQAKAADLEVVQPSPEDQKQLAEVVTINRLPTEIATSLQSSFLPLFQEARTMLEQSRGVKVTDVSQTLQIRLAREHRLGFKRLRLKAEALRIGLKEESMRRGKAIDGFNHILLDLIGTEEKRLQEEEDFAERQEAQRKAVLKTDREKMLQVYGLDTSFYALGEMPDKDFDQLLQSTQLAHEAKLAAQRKIEADRIAAEKARVEEAERMKVENERLRAEAAERVAEATRQAAIAAAEKAKIEAQAAEDRRRAAEDARIAKEQADKAAEEAEKRAAEQREAIERKAAQEARIAAEAAKAEREALEAKARAESARVKKIADAAAEQAMLDREARERAEATLQAQKDAEAKRLRAEAAAAKKAAAAPDKEKLLVFVKTLRDLKAPEMATEETQRIQDRANSMIRDTADRIEQEANNL